jgi:DNA-binding response OmpR family regulator
MFMIHDPVLAHEIRTPLHGVLAAAALLADGALSAEQREHVDTIREAARALLALADGALGTADADASCDARTVVDGVRRLLAPVAAAKGIALDAHVDADVPAAVHIGAGPLRQVLVNLVGNAVKFTPRGAVAVRVRRDGEAVALEVHDTGPGLDAARRERLFQPFTPDGPNGGAGLGLAISAALVQRAGGTIGVREGAEGGSVFWCRLPPAVSDSAVPDSAVPDAAVLDSAAPPQHLLLVDDDPVGRRVGARLLERLGHQVDVAESMAEARAALERTTYDAVVLDRALPDGDGCDLARALGADAGVRPHIVMLTASPDAETRVRCLDAGADAVLVKPAGLDELRAALAADVLEPASRDALVALEHDAPGLLASVAEDYARDTAGHVDALRTAVDASDHAAAARAAHRVRGSSASAGAPRAAALAGLVEGAARAGATPDASRVEALARAVRAAAAELRKLARNAR